MDPVTLGIIGSGLATAGINAFSTWKANQANVSEQRRANAQQLAFAKNAYSFATADRLRAGLSPLDTQQSASPSLSAAMQSPFDVGALSSSVVNAVSSAQRQQEIDTNKTIANAQNEKNRAETSSILIDNLTRAQENQLKLLDKLADIQHKGQVNDTFMQSFNEQMKLNEQTIKKMQQEIATLQSTQRVNNANALQQENQNTWSESLRVPPSLLRSVSANDPQAMLIYNGLLSQWKQRQNSNQLFDLNNQKDLYAAYQDSMRKRQEEIDQTDKEIKAYNQSDHKGKPPYGYDSWQDYRNALAARKKNMRLLSFDEWLSLARKYGL